MIRLRDLRQAIVPAYLFLCVVFGGSAQAIWGKLLLQLMGLVLIALAAVRPAKHVDAPAFQTLFAIGIAALCLIVLQLIPLPPELWSRLPGRDLVVRGYASMSGPLPWLPLSMTPVWTLWCALYLIPPLAVLSAIWRLDACRVSWAIGSLLGATVLSVVLGYIQVSTKSPSWYLYDFTNLGSAVGFFANRNHMGTLLLIAIPFIALILSNESSSDHRRSLATWIAGLCSAVLILLGIAMNGSLAAVLIAGPVIIASMLLFSWTSRFRTTGLIVAACAIVLVVAVVANSPVEAKLNGTETSSITGRQQIWAISLQAGKDAFPAGTGFGSFEQLYRTYDDPAAVTGTFVNHAHNDFIELFIEGGAVAIILVVAFLFWWVRRAVAAWGSSGSPIRRAATIASFTVLAHSAVDYPLRTTAIVAAFAFCLAVMAVRTQLPEKSEARFPPDLRQARHIIIN